jgi:hypothetical protein
MEKAAYLRGLLDGLKIDKTSDTGKLFGAIVDAISDLALEVSDLGDVTDAISQELDLVEDAIDEIDESVEDLWDLTDECDYCDYEDEDYDEDEEEEDDGDYYQLTCPSCGEEIVIDEAGLEKGSMNCPACGEELEFDLEEDEEE